MGCEKCTSSDSYFRENLDRWELGISHHPKSEALFNRIAHTDFQFYDDYFCWKKGGDGDNGETLMYQLDAIFEEDEGNCPYCDGKNRLPNAT